MIDLEAATTLLSALVERVRDDQPGAPTPCVGTTLGDLLDRLIGLTGRDPAWFPGGAHA